MAPIKCCVEGCDATSATHRLFCLPRKDHLRNLWMSFLVPKSPSLLGLTKDQLITRRVCERHFDCTQFDPEGKRLAYAYPCLFTDDEIARGEPLPAAEELANVLNEHNYCKEQDDNEEDDEIMLVIGKPGESFHEHPSCFPEAISSCSTSEIASSSVNNQKAAIAEVKLSSNKKDKDSCTESLCATRSSVKEPLSKKLGSKQRQFMKKVKKTTCDSIGLSATARLKQAQSCANNPKIFQNFQLLSKQAQTFLLMQLRECRKNKMARRFSLEEKLMALLMMKQSPKEYKLLETMFALPNKRTLHRLSEKITVKPGLNPQIFKFIRNKTKNWEPKKKICTIVFDEVAITPHLSYDEKNDQIIGFVNIAGEKSLKICDHALVFMLRGICSPWRQSVAYYFCEGTVSAPALQKILKEIVLQVAQTGLTPLGIVCDQGSTFRTTLKTMRQDTLRLRNIEGLHDDGSVNIAGHNLSIFFDPPHLLKGLRNNFLTKNIIWNEKRASWEDIKFIYDLDSKLGHTRALPNLSEQHVNPEKIKKMKVSIAAKVLSARTAAMLKYTNALNSLHGKPLTMDTTAEVVEFFDTLFDSVNGHPGGSKRGKMRKAVKPDSAHESFWREAIKKLKMLKFEDCVSKAAIKAGKPRLVQVPTVIGWITTLNSFLRLSKLLFQKYGVDFYYPRCINQDPLENFFGRIRALNYRNVNPTSSTFIYAFKSLFLTNIMGPHSRFSNCEADHGETLMDIGFLFEEDIEENKENQCPNTRSLPSTSQIDPPPSSGSQEAILEKVKVQCSAYTAGYICRKITKYIKCKKCLKTYTSSTIEGIHAYIKLREYKNFKNDNLVYPKDKVIRVYRDISQYVRFYVSKNGHNMFVAHNIVKKILSTYQFSWLGCAEHCSVVKLYFIKLIVKLQLHNWCNTINKILKGGIDAKYVYTMDEVQKLALKKYHTFRKGVHK